MNICAIKLREMEICCYVDWPLAHGAILQITALTELIKQAIF